MIERWSQQGVVSAETATRLRQSFEIASFNWRRLARIAILASVICFVVAVASFLADEFIIRLVERLFVNVDVALTAFFAVVAGALYAVGLRRRKRRPELIFTNEGLLFLAVLSTAMAIFSLGAALQLVDDDLRLLPLIGCVIYGAIGLWAQSKLIWVFALVALGGWFGAETGYRSEWATYYLGLGYPLRFVFFGLALSGVSGMLHRLPYLRGLGRSTFTVGLLYLFVALWLLSIFGNYGDLESWSEVKQVELFHWSLLFALAAGVAIWHGLKFDNGVSHGFGITFLFINIYTRFFEYFWDDLHKAIFFGVLAVSLWFLGRHAQRIWTLGRAKELPQIS